MKSFKVISIIALTLLLIASTVHAANWKIEIINNSVEDIKGIYLSSNVSYGSVGWGENILKENNILKIGDSITVNLDSNSSMFYDLKVVYKYGDYNRWTHIDITSYSIINIEGKTLRLKQR